MLLWVYVIIYIISLSLVLSLLLYIIIIISINHRYYCHYFSLLLWFFIGAKISSGSPARSSKTWPKFRGSSSPTMATSCKLLASHSGQLRHMWYEETPYNIDNKECRNTYTHLYIQQHWPTYQMNAYIIILRIYIFLEPTLNLLNPMFLFHLLMWYAHSHLVEWMQITCV